MKKQIIRMAFLAVALASCSVSSRSKLSGEVVAYGPTKVDVSQSITVDQMMGDFVANKSQRKAYTVAANIEEVCAKAGCWINIKSETTNQEMMVRFKDHFTIPTDTKLGTKAFLHGELYTDTVTVDLLRHFAEDAGKSKEEIEKITQPKITMGFEADGITFSKKK